MRGGAEDEENLIEVQMDAHDSGGGDDDDDDDGQASYGEEGAGMSEDEVETDGEDQGEGQERTGMPRHVQRALWRILVGDPARLGPEPSTHEELIDSLKRSRVLINTRVCRAMELIPRGSFVPEEQQGEAYLDCPLAVPQLGFNISAPHIHATCLEKLGLEPGHHFLDVGSGCGLVTCLGAYIVGKAGSVVGVEINDDALAVARANLDQLKSSCPEFELSACQVRFEKHNVFLPDPLDRTYDRINVAGTCPKGQIRRLLALLRPRGMLIVPCASELQLYTKEANGGLRMEVVSNVRFGSLVVPTDAEVVTTTLDLDKRREMAALRRAEGSATSLSPSAEAAGDGMEGMEEESSREAPQALSERIEIDPFDNRYDCLIVGKRIAQGIPAHKRLLSSRCQLFRAQFSSGMKDAHSSEFEIPDFSFQACLLMLDFLYARGAFEGYRDPTSFLQTSADKLSHVPTCTIIEVLQLGIYVNCPELCRFQEHWLETLVDTANCVELLAVADDVGCVPCLHRECLDHIVENYAEVSKITNGFEGLDTHLVAKIASRACELFTKVMGLLRQSDGMREAG